MAWLPFLLCWLAPAAGPGPAPDQRPTAPGSEPAEYAVAAAARSTQVFLLPPGPRTVRALEVVPTPATADAWRAARLRLTWEDDDPDPDRAGVDLPLGPAFGRAGGLPPTASDLVSADGPVWVIRFPMPYRTRALLRIDSGAPLSGRIRLRSDPGVGPRVAYFRGALWSPGTGADPVGDESSGSVAGLFPAAGSPDAVARLVAGGRLVIDGRPAASVADALSPRDPAPAPAGAPRGFPAEPIPFERSFSVRSAGPAEGGAAAVVLWYSDRPAAPGRSRGR